MDCFPNGKAGSQAAKALLRVTMFGLVGTILGTRPGSLGLAGFPANNRKGVWVKGERWAGVGARLLKNEKANSKEVHRTQRRATLEERRGHSHRRRGRSLSDFPPNVDNCFGRLVLLYLRVCGSCCILEVI